MESQLSAADDVQSGIAKAPTGISGLDEMLDGGLPRGRPTIITGRAGCGKTLLSMEFLVHGAASTMSRVFLSPLKRHLTN